MANNYKHIGPCPVCGATDLWFNDIPLKAFCWGTEENPHPEARKTVPYHEQPYGYAGRTRWVLSKEEN
tara:strand:- start:2845 stop:3048 length:204 start_codon:yes stop_codon:yes gene_type:complete